MNVGPTTTKRGSVIRANSAQTMVLKAAFSASNTIAPEELKILSKNTGLPEKWITQWYGRQRSKERRSKVGTTAPQGSLAVKTEQMERSDPFFPPSSPSSAKLSDGFNASTASICASVTQVAKHPRKKKKAATGGTTKKQKVKGEAHTTKLVKAEHLDTAFDLRYTPSPKPLEDSQKLNQDPAQTPSTAAHSGHLLMNIDGYSGLLPLVAPATRSFVPPAQPGIMTFPWESTTGYPPQCIAGIQPAIRTSNGRALLHQTIAAANQLPKPQRNEYQAGPVFHTQFLNNNAMTFSSAAAVGQPQDRVEPMIYGIEAGFSLAIPGFPVPPLSGHEMHEGSFYPPQDYAAAGYLPMSAPNNHYIAPWLQHPQPHSSMNVSIDNADIEDLMHTYRYIDYKILDPFRAPLKHLTDTLESFRDQRGSFAQLLNPYEHDRLKACLLDERDPFKAAMGFVLLDQLGLV